MPDHTFRRATTLVAALGTLLALVLVGLAPTSASAAAPKCRPGYPASVATTTTLSVPRLIRAGQRAVARVSVRSGAGKPSGSVQLSVAGSSYRLTLRGGNASRRLPALRGGRTYRISASYGGRGCYKPSSDGGSITVVRRGGDRQTHFSRLAARSVHRGGHPRVTGRIVKASGAGATGRARVRVSFHGHVRYAKTVRLHHGRFHASFPRVRRVGVWTASVSGAGVSGSTTFRVRR